MSVRAQFHTAWAQIGGGREMPVEMLPSLLTRTAAKVMRVDAAGLSVFSEDFRVPLGASSPEATTAERLQFTVGDGPCLQAVATASVVRASESDIARSWSGFHNELVVHTPYRSIASVPVPVGHGVHGALDMYWYGPTQALSLDIGVAEEVAASIGSALIARRRVPAGATDAESGPPWLQAVGAKQRTRVWIAIGVLVATLDLNFDDALAVLRAYAYSHDQVIDDTAETLIDGTLSPFSTVGPDRDIE